MTTKDIIIRHHNRNISGRLYLPQKDKCSMVIFSHGFNGSGDDFSEYAKILAENGIGAYIFDFCGGSLRSKSDLSTTEMTVFTEKEDLFAVIDFIEKQQNTAKIFLFGASMGGLVSALCAEERANKIQGMILLYLALCVADDWNKRFLNIEEIPAVHSVWNVPLGKSFFETLHSFNVFEHIGKYQKDILIIHGDKDKIVPLEYSIRANEIYTNSKLKIFQNEGHGFSDISAEKTINIIVNFIYKEEQDKKYQITP